MIIESKPTHKKFGDYALFAIGFIVALESAQSLFEIFGWRERAPRSDSHALLVLPMCLILGLYVLWQSSRRIKAANEARAQRLADLHAKADLARERTGSA
jgi:hypothetical protein